MYRWLLLLVALSAVTRKSSSAATPAPEVNHPPASDRAAWLSAFGSLAQVVTGLLAFAVAYVAYLTSLEFRSRDEAKDELQLTPVVSVEITDSTKLEFINQGFGPAILKELYIRSGDKVAFIRKKNASVDEMQDVNEAATGFLEYTFKKDLLNNFARINKIKYTWHSLGDIPLAGQIIGKDGRLVFSESNAKELLTSELVSIRSRTRIRDSINYGERAYNVGVCYCSFTNKHCYFSALRRGITHEEVGQCSDAEFSF